MHTSSLVTPSAQALKSCKNVAADSSSVNVKVTTSSQPVGDTRTALDDAGAGAAGAVPFVIAANAVATAAPSATSAMSRPSTIIAAGLLVHGRVLKYPGEEILMKSSFENSSEDNVQIYLYANPVMPFGFGEIAVLGVVGAAMFLGKCSCCTTNPT